MKKTSKSKIVAGLMSVTALAGAGGAVAATQSSNPQDGHKAFVADAAKSAGVSTSTMQKALDAARKDNPPPNGGPKDGKRQAPPEFAAAAKYLGVTEKQLLDELKGGDKTLADVAKEKGKDVAGLQTAISDAIKAGADAHAKEIVNHKGGGPGGHGGPGGPGGPPPAGQ